MGRASSGPRAGGHYAAGGFIHVLHRPGFEWDVGLHYVPAIETPTGSHRITNNRQCS
jgi:hypothetical protein